MASKYIDLLTVKFFMNNVQELETVLEKERFVDHDLESVNLYVDSVKQFADRELFPYFKEMDENPAHYKDGSIHVHQQVEKNDEGGWFYGLNCCTI
jgi:butyryl-CoA dehydrogenase